MKLCLMTDRWRVCLRGGVLAFVFALLAAAPVWLLHASPQGAATTTRPAQKPASRDVVVVTGTQEAALGQPRVTVQLRKGKQVLTGEPPVIPRDLDAIGDGRREVSFTAFLDTGASGCVLSKSTADRFGVELERDATYHEVGLHGETAVDVSAALDLYLKYGDDSAASRDKRDAREKDPFQHVLEKTRLQISREEPSALLQLAGEMNVIGMPAIRTLVIEIDPSPLRGMAEAGGGIEALLNDGPAVHIRAPKLLPRNADIAIAMEALDFNRRKHPDNRGPLPALAQNLVVPSVQTSDGDHTFTCDWLLDTGAAASIISTRHAKALGLLNADGAAVRPADFTLPLGGIGGQVKQAAGYIIESLKINARNGRSIEFRRVHVVVRDISTTLDDGRTITLDGVLGMNLLLPSASGVADGEPDRISDGPFDQIWIDGPKSTLSLVLTKAPP